MNSSNKSTEIIKSLSFILSISVFNKFAIHIWLICNEHILRFAYLIDSRIMSTFFLGIDVKKYLLKNLFFFFCWGKLVKLTSKSEFSKDIGIWISELGFSRKLIELFSSTSSGSSINLV